MKKKLIDFLEYSKKEFGINIIVTKNKEPDTFEKIFGKIEKGDNKYDLCKK